LLDIEQYSPKVVYKKGTKIPVADLLSRDCMPRPDDLREGSDIEVCPSEKEQWAEMKEIDQNA
jgi:hypothetical protein